MKLVIEDIEKPIIKSLLFDSIEIPSRGIGIKTKRIKITLKKVLSSKYPMV